MAKKWVKGEDMPHFSGKKWSELEDIWPAEVRINDEVYMMLGLFYPAWIKTHGFLKSMDIKLKFRDFLLLCWLHRVEDAKSGVAFQSWPAMKGMNIGAKLWYPRKSVVTKYGLIENLPIKNRAYRVTELGKIVIKKFIENVHLTRQELAEHIKVYDNYRIHTLSDFFGMAREDEEYSKQKNK